MSRRLRRQAGQAAAEYLGVLLIVSVVIAALFSLGVRGAISRAAQSAICTIAGSSCEPAEAARPERTSTPVRPGDADGDGAADHRERDLGLDPHTADSDGDGLPDGQELGLGTDPRGPDSDGDGLSDAEEADAGGALDPRDADAEEVAAETDPGEADGDSGGGQRGDGLTDREEIDHGTDPNAFDTDGDGYSDGYEVEHGRDPTRDERNIVQKGFDASSSTRSRSAAAR